MIIITGSAMCIYCPFQTFKDCYELAEESGEEWVNMNDICPKGRKIHKGNITFEEVELLK